MNTDKLVAHRGDNTHFPENSYAALESALKAGARYIEFDVQMIADGTLIVFHDADLIRLVGNNTSIFNLNNSDLNSMSVHFPSKFSEKFNPTYIPTLQTVLSILEKYPNSHAFVEIKQGSISHWGLNKVMNALLNVLKPYSKQVYIISFSDEALEYTHANSNIKTGLVFDFLNNNTKEIAKQLNPDYLICPYDAIGKKTLWKGDWQWMVYSLNDSSLVKEAFNRKDINLVETDNIQLMLSQN
ncbi:MAG: glycerophosphodiester phosphodiesterase family protein [Cocleimonas sp.]